MKPLDPLHVEVRFGPGIPGSVQAPALLMFEQQLRNEAREQGLGSLWIEVFKETRGDDSKLRTLMTLEERAKL